MNGVSCAKMMRKRKFMLAGVMAAALVMTALPIHAAEENNTFLQEDEDALRVFSNKEKGTEKGMEKEEADSAESAGALEADEMQQFDENAYKLYKQFFYDKYGILPKTDLLEKEKEDTEWYGYFRNSYPVHLVLKADGSYTLESYATHTVLDGTYEKRDGMLVLHTGDGYALTLTYESENSLYAELDGYTYELVRAESGDVPAEEPGEEPVEEEKTKETTISDFVGDWATTSDGENGSTINLSITDSDLQLQMENEDGSASMLYTQTMSVENDCLHFVVYGFGTTCVSGDLTLSDDGSLSLAAETDNGTISAVLQKADNAVAYDNSEAWDGGYHNCWDGSWMLW